MDFRSWSEKHSDGGKKERTVNKMFVRRSMGQYEEYDVSSGDVWTGSVYDPGATPAAWTTEWVKTEQPAVQQGGGSWLTSFLSPLIGGAAQVGSAYLQTQKPTGATILTSGGAATPVTVPATQQAGLLSGSMLPILGIIGIGAFLVLRGKRGKK